MFRHPLWADKISTVWWTELSNFVKYYCRSSESPGGEMMGGRSVVVGFQLLSCMRFISLSGLVTESLTITRPGLV